MVKKDANAQDFDASNASSKNIKKQVLDQSALKLSEEEQAKVEAKWEKVEDELLLRL